MAGMGYDAMIDHVASGDPEATVAACQQALAGGGSAQDTVTREFSKGMRKIARDLNKKGTYLDTMLGGSFAFNAGLEALRPQLGRERGAPEGMVLALRWGMFGLSLVALVVFLVAMRFYPLGKAQVAAMRVRLEHLHQQKAAQLPANP
jgi:hypothetical protein